MSSAELRFCDPTNRLTFDFAVGLVDEAVLQEPPTEAGEHSRVMQRAAAKVAEFLAVPDAARHASKMLQRGPLAERLLAAREEDVEQFSAFCFTPAVQSSLGGYMAALKARSKPNK